MSNRKLIRTTLNDATSRTRESAGPRGSSSGMGRKNAPPEQTSAETFYYLKQMNAKTPMIVTTMDGEILRGWIEWYDRDCIKLNREKGPNILLMKHAIKYMYKQEEERASDRRRRREIEKEQQKDAGRGKPSATPEDDEGEDD